MRLHRFFVNVDLGGGVLRVEGGEVVKQWRDVLRLKDGSEVFIFNGNGAEAKCEITSFCKGGAELKILDSFKNENELARQIVLYCSILKRENFEFVAQKATEVGVAEIVPIIAERTEKLNLRMNRLEKIVKEAAEQSGRAVVPALREPTGFGDAINKSREIHENLFFDKTGLDIKSEPPATGSKPLAVWIGPEGGWTDEEIKLAKDVGFRVVGLGKLTLRAETAAIVASYLVTQCLSIKPRV